MIFTPSFFRGPPASKTFNASSSATHETISKVFNEARIEQQFMLNLLEYLDVTRLEDEDDWIPTHGKHNSLASSLSSSTSSSVHPWSSAVSHFPDADLEGTSRPSLDSTTSTASQSSPPSFGSTKRKNRFHRTRTQTEDPPFAVEDRLQEDPSGLSASPSLPTRSRAITDSFFLHGKSQSSKDFTAQIINGVIAAPLPPLPDLPFIKPVIVVNQAD